MPAKCRSLQRRQLSQPNSVACVSMGSRLAVQARLKVLDLSDNALGEKGVRACAAALSSQVMLMPKLCVQLRDHARQGPD